MAKPPIFGPEILRADIVDRLLPQLWLTHAAQPPIPIRRWARNGKHPNAWLVNAMGEALNQAAMQRTKQVFSLVGHPSATMDVPVSSASTRARWRWACHTGPMAHQFVAIAVLCAPTAVATSAEADSHATVKIFSDATESTLVVSDEFHYGPSPTGTTSQANGWAYLKPIVKYLEVSPDTDYYGLFSDVSHGRLVSGCVYELSSMTANNSGYLPQNLVERAPILSTDRQRMMQLARNLWRRGGAHILNWSVFDASTPRTITSSTPTNVVDGSSTTVGATIPGFYLDLSYSDRRSQSSGVPCVLRAHGSMTSGSSLGRVFLIDSGGNTVTSILDSWSSTASWQSVSFNLPATSDKYYLMFSRGGTSDAGNPFSLDAVSIYQYET